MFLRFVAQSIRQSPRRKLMTIAAIAMGSAAATAVLGVMLEIGDRVNTELRTLGANLTVFPKSASLPVEIGGIRYQPVSRDQFIPQAQLTKLKSIFWALNITGFAPSLKAVARVGTQQIPVDGVWFSRNFRAPDGSWIVTGLRNLNAAWRVTGRWIDDAQPDDRARDCMAGSGLARRLGLAPGATLVLFGEPFHVSGVLSTGGEEDDRMFVRLEVLQRVTQRTNQLDSIQVGALTKPEDRFARKDPALMTPVEFERWNCTPYVSSIAHQIEEAMPMTVARPIRRVADNQGRVLDKIRGLMLLICITALASAALTVWSVMATTVLERRSEIAIMQATGAGNALIAALFAAEVAVQGILGGVFGALAGWRLAGWISQSVFQVAADVPSLLMPLVVFVATAVALAGAAYPLRRSLGLEPAAILREGI